MSIVSVTICKNVMSFRHINELLLACLYNDNGQQEDSSCTVLKISFSCRINVTDALHFIYLVPVQ